MSSHLGYKEYVVYRAPMYCYRRALRPKPPMERHAMPRRIDAPAP